MDTNRGKLLERAVETQRRDPYAAVTIPFNLTHEEMTRLRAARFEGLQRRKEEGQDRPPA